MDDTLLDALLTMADPDATGGAGRSGVRTELRLGLRNGQTIEGELVSARQYLERLDQVTHGDIPPIEWAIDDGLVHLDRVTYNDANRQFLDARPAGAVQLNRADIVTIQIIGAGPR